MLTGISAVQSLTQSLRPEAAAAPGTQATGFADALSGTAMRTVETLRGAEAASIEGLRGGMETREVVDAVMSAEQSLQAAVAIRDKIVQAYLEISRMQI